MLTHKPQPAAFPDDAPSVASTVILTGDEIGGVFTLVSVLLPPHDAGMPLHRHSQHSEGCYVITGILAITVNDRTTTITAGNAVLIPADALHTYWNPTATPTRIVLVYQPGVTEAEAAMLVAGTSPNSESHMYKE